ncbi:MAG: hypothetical protein V4692_00835 [Bdellovibrionota bacterium]
MTVFGRLKILTAAALLGLAFSQANAGPIRLDVSVEPAELNKAVKAKYAEGQKANSDLFDSHANRLRENCLRSGGGPDCSKFNNGQRAKLLVYAFGELFSKLPPGTLDRMFAHILVGPSIESTKLKYMELMNGYVSAHMKLAAEIQAASSHLYVRQGYFPMNKSRLLYKPIFDKYSYHGVTIEDLRSIVASIYDVHLRETVVQVILKRQDKAKLFEVDRTLKSGTNDYATKLIVLRALQSFDKTGSLEPVPVDPKADPKVPVDPKKKLIAVNEGNAIYNLLVELLAVNPNHGIYQDKQDDPAETGIPADLIEVAKNGNRYLKVGQIIQVWESVKSAQIDLLESHVRMHPKKTFKELHDSPLIASISTPNDLAKTVRAYYSDRLLAAFGADVYAVWLYQTLDGDSLRAYYQHEEFLAQSAERMRKIAMEFDGLTKQFPGVITWEDMRAKERESKANAVAEGLRLRKKAKTEAQPKPTGISQIKEGANKFRQWQFNVDRIIGTAGVDLIQRKPLGTTARADITAMHKHMSLKYDYSMVGTPKQLASWNPLEFAIAQTFAPLMSVSSVIGGGMILVEDGWDYSVRSIYGMNEQQYAEALKSNVGNVKYLKYGFYVGQGVISLAVIVGTGGTGAPAVTALNGGRGAVQAATAMGRLKLAASVFIKPMGRRIFTITRRSVSPLGTAFGMSALFAYAHELYESEKEGGHFDRQKWLYSTMTGASTTLGFMMYMKFAVMGMTAAKVSNATIAKTTIGIDLGESVGDWPNTYTMGKEARTRKQWIATVLMGAGNVWDSGDSAAQALRGQGDPLVQEAKQSGELYSKAHFAIVNGMGLKSGDADAKKKALEDNRLSVATSILKRALSAEQAELIATFDVKIGRPKFEEKLRAAGFSEKERKLLAIVYSDEFDIQGFKQIFDRGKKLMEGSVVAGR